MASGAFRGRTVLWLVVIGGLSLLSAIFWALFGGEIGARSSSAADSYSRSAIGHHAFVRLLEELGVPVVVSRWDSGGKAGGGALLLLLEPRPTEERFRDAASLRTALGRARRVLVVLPKWRGRPDADDPGWIGHAALVNPLELEELLAVLGVTGEVVRAPTTRWNAGEVGLPPALPGDAQLLEGSNLSRILYRGERVLFGAVRRGATQLYVLTDPDLLSTAGLGSGSNAALAARLVDWAGGEEGGPVVVDEVFHGFVREPDVYRALFDYPLVLATLHGGLALAALVWAASRRFGAPRPVRPPLAPGKDFLIENIAALQQLGGHGRHALARYLAAARREVAERLHLPAGLDELAARRWLDRHGAARRVPLRLERLHQEVRTAPRRESLRTLAVARRIHRWREEMIHGPRGRS